MTRNDALNEFEERLSKLKGKRPAGDGDAPTDAVKRDSMNQLQARLEALKPKSTVTAPRYASDMDDDELERFLDSEEHAGGYDASSDANALIEAMEMTTLDGLDVPELNTATTARQRRELDSDMLVPLSFRLASDPDETAATRTKEEEDRLIAQLTQELAVDKQQEANVDDMTRRLDTLKSYKATSTVSAPRVDAPTGPGDAPIFDPYEWELAQSDNDTDSDADTGSEASTRS